MSRIDEAISYATSSRKIAPRTTRLFNTKKLNFEKKYNAKSPGQLNYKSHLYDRNLDIIVCNGPAGSGKTALACEYSLDSLHSKNYDKVIITRPTISIEKDLGFYSF